MVAGGYFIFLELTKNDGGGNWKKN